MKINSINISNFLAIKEAAIALNAPCLLIAGPNGAGKSSIAEAVHHALTGEPSRVSLKKEFGALLSDGAAAGHALIDTDEGEFGILLPDGKSTGAEPNPALAFCLDPERFAILSESERRGFLFKLMGVKITGATVSAKLIERGADKAKAAEIIPHVANGFEAAHKEAQSKARDAKAGWRVITGETYGEKKAASWAAQAPAVDAEALAKARAIIAKHDAAIEAKSATLGKLEAMAQQSMKDQAKRAEIESKIAGLKEKAWKFARIQTKLNLDEKELAEWEVLFKDAESKASGSPAHDPLTCPECSSVLLLTAGKLVSYDPQPAGDAEAKAALPELRNSRDIFARSVANGKRDLAEADAAAAQIKALEELLAEPLSPLDVQHQEIAALKESIAHSREARKAAAEHLRQLEGAERDAASAKDKTIKASAHHADVLAWDAIAQALSPDGIPAEFLAEAIGPFNSALADAAYIADWPTPVVEQDMRLTVGGRPYALRSESEKWRADAMIAAAIAKVSGLKIILLDRFDVLDLHGRGDAVAWLDDMAGKGIISTALIFGTLKSRPTNLPETIASAWIEEGAIVNEKEEIAA